MSWKACLVAMFAASIAATANAQSTSTQSTTSSQSTASPQLPPGGKSTTSPQSTTSTQSTTRAQSTADVIAQFGLMGTWASDCGQPASDHNYLTVYAANGSVVSRTYYDKPSHVYNNYKIINASLVRPDLLSYTQIWDFDGKPANIAGDRVNILLNMQGGKFQIVSSQGSDGSYFVADRKFPGSGAESPWQFKCM
jgi:hypothetical protein